MRSFAKRQAEWIARARAEPLRVRPPAPAPKTLAVVEAQPERQPAPQPEPQNHPLPKWVVELRSGSQTLLRLDGLTKREAVRQAAKAVYGNTLRSHQPWEIEAVIRWEGKGSPSGADHTPVPVQRPDPWARNGQEPTLHHPRGSGGK